MIRYDEFCDEELLQMMRSGESGVSDYLMENTSIWCGKKPVPCI